MDFRRFQNELESLQGKIKMPAARHILYDFADWKQKFGDITPKQMHNIFSTGSGKEHKPTIDIFFDTRRTRILLKYSIDQGHDVIKAHVIFEIYADKFLLLDDVDISNNGQAKGVVKNILKASTDFFSKAGYESITVNAVDIGSYAWAKYGFTPSSDVAWDLAKIKLSDRIEGNFLEFKGKKIDITPEKAAIQSILGHDFPKITDSFCNLAELNRIIGTHENQPLTVGKALLLDQRWTGTLNLDSNDKNFQRFMSYASGNVEQLKAK